MKTICVEIPDGVSIKNAMRAIKDIIFVSLGSNCTVRALPQPESTERRCENCIKKKDCDGQDTDALDCPNYIANSAAEQLPQPEQGQALRCSFCDDKKEVRSGADTIPCPACSQPIPGKVDEKNPCKLKCPSPHKACNDFIPVQNNRGFCFNCGHHKSCHDKMEDKIINKVAELCHAQGEGEG